MKEYIKNLSELKQKRPEKTIYIYRHLDYYFNSIVITNMVGLGGFIAEAAKPITDVFVRNSSNADTLH